MLYIHTCTQAIIVFKALIIGDLAQLVERLVRNALAKKSPNFSLLISPALSL